MNTVKKSRDYEVRVNVTGKLKPEIHRARGKDISDATENVKPELKLLYGDRYKIVSIVET